MEPDLQGEISSILSTPNRASTRFDAPFCRCMWLHQVPLGGHEWLSETPVLDLPHVFQALLGGNLQMSFVTTHTSMIDVADLSMFRLLQTPSQAAKPPAAMAVERVVKATAIVLKQAQALAKDTELLKSSERILVYTSGYKRKCHVLIKEGVDKTSALAEARIAGQEAVSTWMES